MRGIFSSNFNRFAPNPSTGEPMGTAFEPVIAHQQVFHTAEYPSRITLPISPESDQEERYAQ
jgi:predicted acyl esterase